MRFKVPNGRVRFALAFAGGALAISMMASTILGSTTAAAPEHRSKVAAYVTAWSVLEEEFQIADIPGERLTHLVYAFGGVSADLRAVLGDPCLDAGQCPPDWSPVGAGGNFRELLRLKESHPHLKVLISLGGWTGSKYFSDVAATAAARERFVASLIDQFFRQFPGVFDGVDLDWEYPVEGGAPDNIERPEDRQNLTLLVQELRRQLDELSTDERYELSVAVSANPAFIENLEAIHLAEIADSLNVMAYDFHTGSTIAHFNAPLYAVRNDPTPLLNIHASIDRFLAGGVPSAKLVLGIAFYGRGYGGVAGHDNGLFQPADPEGAVGWGTGGVHYRELVRRRPERHGFRRFWQSESMVPWLYNSALGIWISFDDPDSVERKASYARARGLKGVMLWEISADDGSLVEAVSRGLKSGSEP